MISLFLFDAGQARVQIIGARRLDDVAEEQLAEDAEILPDTGVTVGQERRWYKEHEGLLMHAIDLYKPEINYNQLRADQASIQESEAKAKDFNSEDIPL